MTDTESDETTSGVTQSQRIKDRFESCETCDGPIDPQNPNYYKSVNDEEFHHKICHEEGNPPDGYVWEWDHEKEPVACMNKQYNCGHCIYGPPNEWPTFCPECNDMIHHDGEWIAESWLESQGSDSDE